jgi:putative aldouronate transport system substrate-binding protein
MEMSIAFRYGDPDGNGEDDTYAFGLHQALETTNAMFGPTFHFSMGVRGTPALYRDADGELGLGFMQPGVRDYLAFLRDAWAEGVIDPGSLTVNSNKDFWHAGLHGAYRQQPEELFVAQDAMRDVDPEARVLVLDPMEADGYPEPVVPRSSGWFRIQQITNAVRDEPEIRKIMEIWDWLLGDGYDLMDKGIEGIHHTIEDGRPVPTGYYEQSGWSNLYSLLRRQGPEWYFNAFNRGTERVDEMTAVFQRYLGLPTSSPIVLSDQPEAQELGADLERIRLEGVFQIIVGDRPLSDLDAIQQAWLDRGARQYLEQAREILGE